jgi:MFS superfamily sulfate permease-like transporter
VTGADSRTAVNLSSGGRTALAPIAAGLFMIAIVAAFTAPLTLLPRAALGAVLLSAGIGLIDFKALRHLARVGPQELGFALVAMAGVIWVGVLQGVFLAILATFIYLLALVSRPRNSRMGWIPDETDMVPLDRYPTARLPEDGVVFIFEASLLFVNADYFRERAFAELDAMPQARWFVLDASGMPYADSTAIATLLDFREALRARGLHFSISGGHGRFWEILARAGAVTTFTEEEIHSTAAQAVDRVRARAALGPPGVVG